jgi:catalase
VIPGIDFTNDPLQQGRNFSYLDTQLLRLGGPNFTQIPINAPVADVYNNQRDGFHQHQIHRGRANYEPNSLGGGCPFQAGAAGFSSFAERLLQTSREADPVKLRVKPEKFAEHYAQARLFFESQSPIEQQHIIDALRFELTRVQTAAVRRRVVAQLRNVDERLAQAVASGLGMALPEPLPAAIPPVKPEIERSPALSLLARPGDGSVATRRIALLVAAGMDTASMTQIYAQLTEAGALPRYVGRRLGTVQSDGEALPVEVTFEAAPSVLWDAVVLPSGEGAAEELAMDDHVAEFLMQQWRHNKAMLVPQSAEILLHVAGVDVDVDVGDEETDAEPGTTMPDAEERETDAADDDEVAPGLLLVPDAAVAEAIERFIELVARHRSFDRFNGNAMEPPAVDLAPMDTAMPAEAPAQ